MVEPIRSQTDDGKQEDPFELGTFELPDPAQIVIPTPAPASMSLLWEPERRSTYDGVDGEKDFTPDVDIFVTQEVISEVQQHLADGGAHEHAGFLLGNRHRCVESGREFVMIDVRVEAQYTQNTPLSVTFTAETWANFKDELATKFRGKMAAGWYHSHPNLGVFLSPDDTGLHSRWFNNAFTSALVIDPVRHEGGFFASRQGALSPSQPVAFYELLSRDQVENRGSAITWKNYRCRDPRTGKIFFPRPLVEPKTASSEKKKEDLGKTPETPEKPWLRFLSNRATVIALALVIGLAIFWPKQTTTPVKPDPLPVPAPQPVPTPAIQKPQLSAALGPFLKLPHALSKADTAEFDWVKLDILAPSPWEGQIIVRDWNGEDLEVIQDPRTNHIYYVGLTKTFLNSLHRDSLTNREIYVGEQNDKYLSWKKEYAEAGFARRNLAKLETEKPLVPDARDVKSAGRPASQGSQSTATQQGPSSLSAADPKADPNIQPRNQNATANTVNANSGSDTQVPPSIASPANSNGHADVGGATKPRSDTAKQPDNSTHREDSNSGASPTSDRTKSSKPSGNNSGPDLSTVQGWGSKIGQCNSNASFNECVGPESFRLFAILENLKIDNQKRSSKTQRDKYNVAQRCIDDLTKYDQTTKLSKREKLRTTVHEDLARLHTLITNGK